MLAPVPVPPAPATPKALRPQSGQYPSSAVRPGPSGRSHATAQPPPKSAERVSPPRVPASTGNRAEHQVRFSARFQSSTRCCGTRSWGSGADAQGAAGNRVGSAAVVGVVSAGSVVVAVWAVVEVSSVTAWRPPPTIITRVVRPPTRRTAAIETPARAGPARRNRRVAWLVTIRWAIPRGADGRSFGSTGLARRTRSKGSRELMGGLLPRSGPAPAVAWPGGGGCWLHWGCSRGPRRSGQAPGLPSNGGR